MFLRRFYHDGLAQASYMLGCQATGEALVVDPNRHIEQYIDAAVQAGLRITAITETHIHADFVSGAKGLAERTGGRLYLSDEGPEQWKYAYVEEAGAVLLHDGDVIQVGNVRVQVLHTPGHTPEHISLLVTDTRSATEAMGIFTGDFVFVGDVGRPDLLERAAGFTGTMEAGARQLFRSLQRFKQLPDYLQVWPAHGAGSACGKSLGAVPQSTVGYEKLFNWALRISDEAEFVREVLKGQPEPPAYFAQMKRINKEGPQPRPKSGAKRQTEADLERARREGMPVVDVRSAAEYAAWHVPGTTNIPWGSDFLSWAGWLLPYEGPVGLVTHDGEMLRVREELQLIGIDQVDAYWTPQTLYRPEVASEKAKVKRRSASELASAINRSTGANGAGGNGVLLLDVRTPAEHAAGCIPGSLNIPLYQLQARLGEIPHEREVVVYCAAGSRSPVAASILNSHGRQNVTEMYDGFVAWQACGCPVERAGISAEARAGMASAETAASRG